MASKKQSAISPSAGEIIPAEVKAELEKEYGAGNVLVFRHPDGTAFGFRRAKRQDVNQYRARLRREDEEALERLLRECVVWPSREAFAAHIDRLPFSVVAFGTAFLQAQGDGELFDADPSDLATLPEGTVEQHPDAAWVVYKDGTLFALNTPGRDVARSFSAALRSTKSPTTVVETLLFQPHTVYPPSADLAAYVDANLFIIQTLGDKVAELGGMGSGATVAVK